MITFIYEIKTIIYVPKSKRSGYTTIGIPIYLRDKLKEYGDFGESWADLLTKLLNEVDDAKKIKDRYKLK